MSARSPSRRWEHFEHMADIGVRGIGPSREAAFEEAALAMCAVVSDPDSVHRDTIVEVDCNAKDDELLFVDWLNVLIYEMSAHRLIFSRFG
jgi:SHS2 domain-containing protein